MRTRLACTALVVLAWLAEGCTIVSPAHRDEVLGRRDGGDGGPDTDAGGPRFDDRCGAPNPRMVLRGTTRDIMIDTTEGYGSDNGSSCGLATPGNDVFIAVDVVEGEYWHFHLSARTPGSDPMLYLTQATQCDSRSCQYVSAMCTGETGEEHFAFVADHDGRWYIGIDDSTPGGGRYVLQAYRPVCGDGVEEHGEACDDGDRDDRDGCDRHCRYELSEARTIEREPNDNAIEANALIMPASNVLEITGNIGGGTCLYHDVFAVTVPDQGDLLVESLDPNGSSPCVDGSTTPFEMLLEDARGQRVVSSETDPNGCTILRARDRAGGEYFVHVYVDDPSIVTAYRLRFSIQP
ncbi:MAG TPA: hypothetical protein VIL20_13505 [Sandaracinaceae bacterium]